MKNLLYREIVLDAELIEVMYNNQEMFGSKPGRQWIIEGLQNVSEGYQNGSGVTALLEHFELIKRKSHVTLTKRGLAYLLSISEEKRLSAVTAVKESLPVLLDWHEKLSDGDHGKKLMRDVKEAIAVSKAAIKINN